jgi:hypothetical protein
MHGIFSPRKILHSPGVAELFWAFGGAEGVARQALQEWLDSTDSMNVQLAEYLEEARRESQDGGDEA